MLVVSYFGMINESLSLLSVIINFVAYNGQFYLFLALIDQEYIGAVRIDCDNLANSTVVFRQKCTKGL